MKEGGSGKGGLVTGQSKDAGLKHLMLTHYVRREAAQKSFFFETPPPLVIQTSK